MGAFCSTATALSDTSPQGPSISSTKSDITTVSASDGYLTQRDRNETIAPKNMSTSIKASTSAVSTPVTEGQACHVSVHEEIVDQSSVSTQMTTPRKDETIFGIKLSYLFLFVKENGDRSFFEDKSTAWVCDNIIIKKYKDSDGLSVCQQLRHSKPDVVGTNEQIKWFISHAWNYKFLDVVDALSYTFRRLDESEDVIVWFDLFSLHQSGKRETIPYEFLSSQFLKNVAVIKNVMMVADNWQFPFTLTRAWCVFELYSCHTCKGRFELAMTESVTADFKEAVDSAKYATTLAKAGNLRKTFGELKTEKCDALVDKDTIQKAISENVEGGFNGLDRIVIDSLLKYIFHFSNYKKEEEATLTRVTGLIFEDVGRVELAMEYFEKALGLREQRKVGASTICTSKIDISRLKSKTCKNAEEVKASYRDLLRFAFVEHRDETVRKQVRTFFSDVVGKPLENPFTENKMLAQEADIQNYLN